MGFDLQPWEARGPSSPGARVRVQGDLTVEVLEVYPEGGCRLSWLVAVLKAVSKPMALTARLQRVLLKLGPRIAEKNFRKATASLTALAVKELRPRRIDEYLEETSYRMARWIMDKIARMQSYKPDSIPLYIRLADGSIATLSIITFKGSDYYMVLDVYSDAGGYSSNLRARAKPDFLDLLASLIASKALEVMRELALFEATINGAHVVRGYGAATVSLPFLPSPKYLMLPTMKAHIEGALETLEDGLAGRDPAAVLRGLAELLSAITFYDRMGDLYLYTVYTAEGRLYFRHSEHGEAIMDLGGPAVVRVTTLNAQAPPRFR